MPGCDLGQGTAIDPSLDKDGSGSSAEPRQLRVDAPQHVRSLELPHRIGADQFAIVDRDVAFDRLACPEPMMLDCQVEGRALIPR